MKHIGIHVFLAACFVFCLTGADWRQFRGNDANGVSPETLVPTSLDEPDWKAPLTGRGLSGPIVIGDQVVVTSSSGHRQDRLHVQCFDANTGRPRWHRQFWATGRTMTHRKMCVATPTPASDGKRIFAFYSSNDLVCLDLDGRLQWYRGLGHDFPNASNSLGMASSPLVVDDTVIVQVESEAEAFVAGINSTTGETRWQITRNRKANWTSPTLLQSTNSRRTLVLLQSGKGLAAVEPRTGEAVWSWGDGAQSIPSSTVSNGMIFVPSGGLTALQPVSGGSPPSLVWQKSRLSPSTASPVAHDGRVYTINSAGVLTCADAKTGDTNWQLRLRGKFSGTPVIAGNHLYAFSETGYAHVVRLGEDEGELVAQEELGEIFLATAAISDGAVYIRSDEHLWKFER